MSGDTAAGLLARLRRRAAIQASLLGLPIVLALRIALFGDRPWVLHDLKFAALLAALAALAALRVNRTWLRRRLDLDQPAFEDSAELLWQSGAIGLPALQRDRLRARLADCRPAQLLPWPLLGAWLKVLALAGLLAATPLLRQQFFSRTAHVEPPASADQAVAEATGPSVAARLQVQPPAYTGVEAFVVEGFDAELPEGSRLRWQLRVAPTPAQASLRFHDGGELSLVQHDDGWIVEHTLVTSARYRLWLDGAVVAGEAPAHRLDVRPDRAPRIEVEAPAQTLSIVDSARPVELRFTVEDDYALGEVRLHLTLARSEGEQLHLTERSRVLRGEGESRRLRFGEQVAPAELGFAPGDDLILRIEAVDNRSPDPQRTRSPAYILRWPPPPMRESEGMEGIVQRTMPAYFRSQRQIIIDSEALLAERARHEPDAFVRRSDAVGVDQRLLRLRYGQFLGEEAEGDGMAAPPSGAADDGDNHEDDAGDDDNGHGHGIEPGPTPSEAAALIAEFAHNHDHAEAATLFDPATRELLRSALREMWSSELHLRQGDPAAALPYQYRALDFIKQVQQAGRIYLARVGLELPAIDFGRRLSGDLAKVRPRRDALAAASATDPIAALWQALEHDEAAWRPALEEALILLRSDGSAEALTVLEAADRLQSQPHCLDCAHSLRDLLWSLLRPPAAVPGSRMPADAIGRSYLDAIEEARR